VGLRAAGERMRRRVRRDPESFESTEAMPNAASASLACEYRIRGISLF
jgi:hypothetical protein